MQPQMPTIDPVILFFVMGIVAGLARADLRLPGAIYEFVSTVLLLAIGLKGGVELARDTGGMPLLELAGVMAIGLALPLPAFLIARHVGRLPRALVQPPAAAAGSAEHPEQRAEDAYRVRLAMRRDGSDDVSG